MLAVARAQEGAVLLLTSDLPLHCIRTPKNLQLRAESLVQGMELLPRLNEFLEKVRLLETDS